MERQVIVCISYNFQIKYIFYVRQISAGRFLPVYSNSDKFVEGITKTENSLCNKIFQNKQTKQFLSRVIDFQTYCITSSNG